VEANYYVVTEWKKEDSGKMRRVIQAKRRHFHNTKRSFASQVSLNDAPTQDVLLDDSKESQVRELGEGIKEIELHGNYFGQFSLTVVIYDLDLTKVDRACADFYKVFSVRDAQLYEEKYNLLNAFLAAVPGNHVFNFRFLYLLNTNYADFSFLFTLHCGEPRNLHLRRSISRSSRPIDGERARVDIELATGHYRLRNLVEKVRAGFSIYAHSSDVSNLRRILDQRELTAEILSL
jgi:hypothetical protein